MEGGRANIFLCVSFTLACNFIFWQMSSRILIDVVHKVSLELYPISHLLSSMSIPDEEKDDVHTQVTEPTHLKCLSCQEPHNVTVGTILQALRRGGGTTSPTCKYRGHLVPGLLRDASRTC